jgi:hypothetical protein
VKNKHIVHGLPLKTERARELARTMKRAAVASEGDVKGHVTLGKRAWNRVLENVTGDEILEKVTAGCLC